MIDIVVQKTAQDYSVASIAGVSMHRLSLVILSVIGSLTMAACGGPKTAPAPKRVAAPPVAIKPMPPLPDLSKVRVFTKPIPGTPMSKVGVTKASLVRLGALKYPQRAWDRGIQGWAVFDFVVAPNGRVDLRYLKLVASSDPIFTKPAEAAVRAARFKPAIMRGTAVATLVRLPVYFSMDQAARVQ